MEMVAICQAVTAWHFATISLLAGSRKRSEFSGLLRNGNSRPLLMAGHMIMVAICQADTQWWIATVLLSLIRL